MLTVKLNGVATKAHTVFITSVSVNSAQLSFKTLFYVQIPSNAQPTLQKRKRREWWFMCAAVMQHMLRYTPRLNSLVSSYVIPLIWVCCKIELIPQAMPHPST